VPLLLEANEIDSGLIGPLVGTLLSKSNRIGHERLPKYQIDRTFLSAFCPDKELVRRLLEVVANMSDFRGWSEDVTTICQQLRDDARGILDKKK